jgi:hypothetical protein
MSNSNARQLSPEFERQFQRALDELEPLIEKRQQKFAALVRQMPGWEEGLSLPEFLTPLLQREYKMSLSDVAGLTEVQMKMYVKDMVRKAKLQTRSAMPPADSTATHSDDYTSVDWFGVGYRFTKGQQAESVRVLWEAWQNKTPTLSEKTIGEKIGSSGDNFQLAKVFRKKKKRGGYALHEAWGKMIVRSAKGTYQLATPEKEKQDQES